MDPLVIIQHEPDGGPGLLARSLELAGVPFRLCRADKGEPLPASPVGFSATVLLGGSMNTHDAKEFPFLDAERELIAACLRADAPLLAICLGAQLLAEVAGGQVYRRSFPEIGWVEVDVVTPDPLVAGVPPSFMCLEWHEYSFRLPPGALRVAARPDGEQVFRIGRQAWGLQFHPEVDEAILERWIVAEEDKLETERPGLVAAIRADTNIYLPTYPELCRRLVGNFLEACELVPRR
jgi:GMP synthase (glutamine-hydrolysing)